MMQSHLDKTQQKTPAQTPRRPNRIEKTITPTPRHTYSKYYLSEARTIPKPVTKLRMRTASSIRKTLTSKSATVFKDI